MSQGLAALGGSLVLAAVFVNPWPRDVLDERRPGFRSFVSFAAGASLAYVFVDLLPELGEAGEELLAAPAAGWLPYPEYAVHAAALLGFVLFYGLERLVRWTGSDAGTDPGTFRERRDYVIRVVGSGAYAWLVVYLMVVGLRAGSEASSFGYYLVAMALHFVALRHSLRYEEPALYDARGRWALAIACLAGWGVAALVAFPPAVVALLLGFLGGMLVMNTTVMEMPSEKEGRFLAFTAGSVLFAAFLMLA